jgi:hypothetical protein
LLQILWAMMPQELAPDHRRTMEARMRAYKNASYCLQDFMVIYDERADKTTAPRYQYFIDMAGTAWTEYQRWKKLELWNDKHLLERLRQAVRGEDGMIREVSDGIVFPILSALSRFVKMNKGHWKLIYPKVFQDDDMLIAARRQLTQCGGRPMLMGRSGAAYEALILLTEMAERYSNEMTAL